MRKNSPDSLLPPAAPGLDEPLEMLHACHERIRAQLGTLRRLAEWLPQHGADEQALRAAQAVMRYFDLAAVNHHLDEEDDLLPAMLAAAEESAQTDAAKEAELAALQQLARRVLREHGLLTARWEAVREKLTEIAQGRTVELAPALVEGFARVYEEHIELEEGELLPWAERLLGPPELEIMSDAMTARRREPVSERKD